MQEHSYSVPVETKGSGRAAARPCSSKCHASQRPITHLWTSSYGTGSGCGDGHGKGNPLPSIILVMGPNSEVV
jgi:hypothetical protein